MHRQVVRPKGVRDDPITVTISTQRKTVTNPDEFLKDLNTH